MSGTPAAAAGPDPLARAGALRRWAALFSALALTANLTALLLRLKARRLDPDAVESDL